MNAKCRFDRALCVVAPSDLTRKGDVSPPLAPFVARQTRFAQTGERPTTGSSEGDTRAYAIQNAQTGTLSTDKEA